MAHLTVNEARVALSGPARTLRFTIDLPFGLAKEFVDVAESLECRTLSEAVRVVLAGAVSAVPEWGVKAHDRRLAWWELRTWFLAEARKMMYELEQRMEASAPDKFGLQNDAMQADKTPQPEAQG